VSGAFASTVAGHRRLVGVDGVTAVLAGICRYALLCRHPRFA